VAAIWPFLHSIARWARARRLAGLFALLVLAGCATPTPPTAPAAPPSDAPVTDVAARVHALLPLDALLLGEQHDNPDHQRIHHEVIEALAARGALGAVLIEMAPLGGSTQGLDASASEASVKAALRWDERAWPWATYAPAVMAGVRAGIVVTGANLPRDQMPAAMRQTDMDLRLSGPALKAQQQLIRSGHCDALPEGQITPMTRVQIARDVAMANTIARAVGEARSDPMRSGKLVLLLAGSGHVDTALGVPRHLPPTLRSKSVLLLAQSAPSATKNAADFDHVWVTASVPDKDYCGGFREKTGG
jgi:uncharacterized iron-regulated protein